MMKTPFLIGAALSFLLGAALICFKLTSSHWLGLYVRLPGVFRLLERAPMTMHRFWWGLSLAAIAVSFLRHEPHPVLRAVLVGLVIIAWLAWEGVLRIMGTF